MQVPAPETSVFPTPMEKSRLLAVIRGHLAACRVDRSQPVLVVGGRQEDLEILSACGFERILLTNLDASASAALDAENIALPDDSFPVVFAHDVLHHCRSPQKAVGEMVRVSQKHVFFAEPNDSLTLRVLVGLGFSFPYEIAAVVDNGYTCGGMRNGPVPNYFYRWTGREVEKSVYTYHPERQFHIRACPYWDFDATEDELLARKQTLVSPLAAKLGPRNLLSLLYFGQRVLNLLPFLRSQGNKFFCAISKRELQPWIETREGQYLLKKKSSGH